MAGKALKDFKDTIQYKLTGQKYHNNLLGESLQDLLRKATAKTLEQPDEATNQQVIETIHQEATSGKDTKEIVSMLKARLRMDHPQKQWLAVKLMEQVMQECHTVLGGYQEEFLQEVARVMARPAKPDTDAGKRARQAAKELLRKYGRAGTDAFRQINQEGLPRAPAGYYPPPGQYPVYPAPGGTAYGYPPPGGAPPPGGGDGVNIEKESVISEVTMLIDKAKSNTELLSDMLVNQSAQPDDFESELVKDLVTEVRELRELFTAYLEQMSAMEGAEMEVLLVQALEAADLLDGALALQKDVALNQQELSRTAPAAGSSGAAPAGAAAAGAAAGAAAAAAPPPKKNDDLIALDDLADALNAQHFGNPAGTVTAHDPFAASHVVQDPFTAMYSASAGQSGGGAPAAPGPGPAPAAAGPNPQRSAFENMFAQPGASQQTYMALSAAAPGVGSPPPMGQAPAPAAAAPQAGYPQLGQYPGPAPGYAAGLGYPQPYGSPPAGGAPPPGYQGMPPQMVMGAQQGAFAPQPHMQFAQAPAPGPQPGSMVASNNPFAAVAPMPSGGDSMFLPMAPMAQSTNPFAAAAASSGGGAFPPAPAPAPAAAPGVSSPPKSAAGTTSVDQEWDLFFADRAAGAQAAAQAQKQG
mmetsp:Transcript_32751/g.72344  ORF Transcript_32751/g.72344 Transcript_32751/m.72344 type:complete len:639 (-) Transcript_32751:491-2407(-)|eukprot:CAMPEP_0202890528 /NCGR_PEP_ID=MMETSP1392-20130828/896_1 /ASSEMBLY_ACC=CAM_ASM_000868 /TAXON_ID=225041 /ORGANISM="Chlamydomonas chlamydogama, Strain SAG 11-48b" /LENGTH=638 /DNA_ID=CAMNT_0049574113 /DNA_START=148 /DNA_END=2064 /DNA_ORIENTATION=+